MNKLYIYIYTLYVANTNSKPYPKQNTKCNLSWFVLKKGLHWSRIKYTEKPDIQCCLIYLYQNVSKRGGDIHLFWSFQSFLALLDLPSRTESCGHVNAADLELLLSLEEISLLFCQFHHTSLSTERFTLKKVKGFRFPLSYTHIQDIHTHTSTHRPIWCCDKLQESLNCLIAIGVILWQHEVVHKCSCLSGSGELCQPLSGGPGVPRMETQVWQGDSRYFSVLYSTTWTWQLIRCNQLSHSISS